MEVKPGTTPDGWVSAPLGRLCGRITTGKLDANAMVADGDYPFFTCAKERYRINKYAFDCEALLVSGNGANVGYVHHYKGKFNAYQRTYVISDFYADVQFLKLFLDRNLQERIRVEVNAGNTPYITMGTLTEMGVVFPKNPAEQRAIAEALSDVDGLLEGLDRLIDKKRDLILAAMQQLLTGKTRLPGFSGEWNEMTLGELGQFLKGNGVTKDQSRSGSLPCVRYGELYTHHNNVIRDFYSWISKEAASTALRLRRGDILFAGSGETKEEIGKCAAFTTDVEAYAGGDIIVLRPREADPAFLGYFLNIERINCQKASRGQGDAVVHISSSALAAIQCRIPKTPEQTAIAEVLTDMDAELAALEQRREKTLALKQAMMQELLTGKTRLI